VRAHHARIGAGGNLEVLAEVHQRTADVGLKKPNFKKRPSRLSLGRIVAALCEKSQRFS
jgi:hypothetical protein